MWLKNSGFLALWFYLLALAFCSTDCYAQDTQGLLRKAVQLSRELRELNGKQAQELKQSRENLSTLEAELAVLRKELETSKLLLTNSQTELTEVSNLLRKAETDLKNLWEYWESLSTELLKQKRRADRSKYWIIGAFLAGTAAGFIAGITM